MRGSRDGRSSTDQRDAALLVRAGDAGRGGATAGDVSGTPQLVPGSAAGCQGLSAAQRARRGPVRQHPVQRAQRIACTQVTATGRLLRKYTIIYYKIVHVVQNNGKISINQLITIFKWPK